MTEPNPAIESLLKRIEILESLFNKFNEHHTRQIDENRKISRRIDDETNSRVAQIDVLHQHIEKLHDMINLEDGITACDVLNRLTQLETNCIAPHPIKLSDRVKDIEYRLEHIVELPTELDIRLQDVERILDKLGEYYVKLKKEWESKLDVDYKKWCQYFSEVHPNKTPFKCPICGGCGSVLTEAAKVDFDGMLRSGLEIKKSCHSCEGKGVLWG